MANPHILVIGSANMDALLPVHRIPVAGESIITNLEYRYIPGGKGANAAICASRLGAGTIFCARLGDDSNGRQLEKTYEKEGIDTRFIAYDKESPTGLAVILLEQNGDNRIIVYPGANLNMDKDNIEKAFLSYPDAVLLNFENNAESIITATEYARKQKIPVFADAGPTNKSLNIGLLKNVEIFSPNEVETKDLTGINPSSPENLQEACIKLAHKVETKYIVLKLSNRGCFVYDGKYFDFIQAIRVNAVDTTAAGDAFTAALTYKYMQTGDISHACRYANAVGALTVTKLGAATSLPSSDQVDEFIRLNNIKMKK